MFGMMKKIARQNHINYKHGDFVTVTLSLKYQLYV